MLSTRLAVALLSGACITAAAGGGYLATRDNSANATSAPSASTTSPTPAQPVQETEAVVGDPTRVALAPEAEPPTSMTVPVEKPARAAARPAPRAARPAARAEARNSQPPALERSWPSSAAPQTTVETAQGASPDPPTPPLQAEEQVTEPPREPEPPEKRFEELVISADSVIGLQLDSALSSERARVEDRVEARVVRDVRVGSEVAVPAGARAIGSVMLVERGGKFKERARLGIRFHTLVLADGTRLPVTTETIFRQGDAPGNSSAAKIGGGAVAGAILGAIIGGAKGAAVGATAGAGGGTAAVMASDRNAATFPAGTEVTAHILSPVTVTVER